MIGKLIKYFKDNGRRAYFELCLYLFVFFLPMGKGIDAVLIVPLAISWGFVSSWKVKKENLKKNRLSLLLIVALHALFWIGMLYSEAADVAFGRIERSLALIVLPALVFALDKRSLDIKKIFFSLGGGLVVVMLVSWASIARDILSKPWPARQAKYFFEWIYTDWNLLKTMDLHPGYFVLFLVLFLAALFEDGMFKELRKNYVLYIGIVLLFLLFLVETTSRVGFISLIILLGIYGFRKTTGRRRWVYLGIIFSLVVAATQFEYLNNKFEKLIDTRGNITFERYQRWLEIIKTFSEEDRWLIGVGTGDVYEIYQKAYANGEFVQARQENYNAHNQYLEFLIGNGILGVSVYLTVLTYFVIRTKMRHMAAAFVILIVLFSFSESFLIRSKGVFFFAFFYALFINHYQERDGTEQA